MKILYLQGFRAFNGCKPILTITEERRTRESRIQGLNNYTGIAEKRTQAVMLARGCREMLAVSGDNSARCLAKQVVSERVQCLSPFRWERMRTGVCRTMKIENYVHKLHGVGGGDLSASDCFSPLPVAGGDVPGGRCPPEGCSVCVSYAYAVYVSIMYTYNPNPLGSKA